MIRTDTSTQESRRFSRDATQRADSIIAVRELLGYVDARS